MDLGYIIIRSPYTHILWDYNVIVMVVAIVMVIVVAVVTVMVTVMVIVMAMVIVIIHILPLWSKPVDAYSMTGIVQTARP